LLSSSTISHEKSQAKISTAARWMTAARAFSLPASLVPVLFGGLLAVAYGAADFDLPGLLLALLGMSALHIAANMLNDCCDFKLGLDELVTPGSGAVVRRILAPQTVLAASVMLFLLGAAIGIHLALRNSLLLLPVGGLGIAIGVLYSTGPYPLKHHALGDFAVFFAFGILGSLGSWIVQTGTAALMPVVWAVPIALHIIAIVHANNWRDQERDRAKSVLTVAGCLGAHAGAYYIAMLLTPYALLLVYIFLPRLLMPSAAMSPLFLIAFLSLPRAFALCRAARAKSVFPDSHSIDDLDAKTAQLSMLFGMLCILAVVLDRLF
jgi:1,4-dihydroxy-2-naphthoate polyprenyltransferase